LAQACLATGKEAEAREIFRQVAAENHEDRNMIAKVQSIYTKAGKEEDGQALLAEVGKEIVELNNRGVLAARNGDVEGSVKLLMEAAERVPNLQFLVNATKAIFTLLDQKGWDADLARRGLRYLQTGASEGHAQCAGDLGTRAVPAGRAQVRRGYRLAGQRSPPGRGAGGVGSSGSGRRGVRPQRHLLTSLALLAGGHPEQQFIEEHSGR
jgi:hypothetical protein